MIYFVRKSEVDKLPAGAEELERCLQRMVEHNEAIGIDRMPPALQMDSFQMLLSNPSFTLVQVQEGQADRFIRSPIQGHASEVYIEALEVVTDYIRDLQQEIARGAASLSRYRDDQEGHSIEHKGLRQALIDLGERREVLALVVQEIRHRVDEQMTKEKIKAAEKQLENE